MGDLITRVRVDLSQWQRGISTMMQQGTAAAQAINRGFTAGVAVIRQHEQQIRGLGLSLSALGATASASIGLSIRQFTAFESSIARAVGAAGGGRQDMQQFSAVARQMANELGRGGVTANAAADALFGIASAGFKGEEAIRALRPALVLAAATQSDLGSITNSVIATLNQFGLSTVEASRITNVFAAVNQNSLATMEKLTMAMTQAGPAAAAMGLSVEATSAALGILFNAGLRAETAGVGLRNILLGLTDVTKESREALAAYGITLADVNPQTRSLADIVDLFTKKQVDATTIVQVFGRESFVAFEALRKGGGNALRDMQQKLTGTNAAMEQFRVQAETSGSAVREMASQTGLLAQQMGERFLRVLQPAIEGVTHWVRSLRQASGPVLDLVAVLGVGIAGTATLTGGLLLFVSIIPRMVAGLALIKAAIIGLLPFFLSPTGLIIVLGALAVAAVVALALKFTDLGAAIAGARQKAVDFGPVMFSMIDRMKVLGPSTADTAAALRALNEATEAATAVTAAQVAPVKEAIKLTKEESEEIAKLTGEFAALFQTDAEKEVAAITARFKAAPAPVRAWARSIADAIVKVKELRDAEDLVERARQTGLRALRQYSGETDGLTRRFDAQARVAGVLEDDVQRLNQSYARVEEIRARTNEERKLTEQMRADAEAQREVQRETQRFVSMAERGAVGSRTFFDALKDGSAGFVESFSSAVNQFGDMTTTMKELGLQTARNLQAGFSDLFFNLFTGNVQSAGEVFAQFGRTLLRAVTDFLAAQAVRTFLTFAAEGINSLIGGFNRRARGGFAGDPGDDPRDVIPTLLRAGEFVLTPGNIDLLSRIFGAPTPGVPTAGAVLGGTLTDLFPALGGTIENFMGGGVGGVLLGMSPSQQAALVAEQTGLLGLRGLSNDAARQAGFGGTTGALTDLQNAIGLGNIDLGAVAGGIGFQLAFLNAFGRGDPGSFATLATTFAGSAIFGAGGAAAGLATGVALLYLLASFDQPSPFLERRTARSEQAAAVYGPIQTALAGSGTVEQMSAALRGFVPGGPDNAGMLLRGVLAENLTNTLAGGPWNWPANDRLRDLDLVLEGLGFGVARSFDYEHLNSIGELIAGSGRGVPRTPWEGVERWETILRDAQGIVVGLPGSAIPRTQRPPVTFIPNAGGGSLFDVAGMIAFAGDLSELTRSGEESPAGLAAAEFFAALQFSGTRFDPADLDDNVLRAVQTVLLRAAGGAGPLSSAELATLRLAGGFPIDTSAIAIGDPTHPMHDVSFGSAETGGLIEVHDGEAIVPRPFVDEFLGGGGGLRVGAINVYVSGKVGNADELARELAPALERELTKRARRRARAGNAALA